MPASAAKSLSPIPRPARAPQQMRQVRLFRNGRNQAVRIPREFEMPGLEATLRKEGDALILEPVRKLSLLALLASFSSGVAGGTLAAADTLPEIVDALPDPVRL